MGASNLAARRAAKANRRKAIVAQKRKAEAMMGSLSGQVTHAAALPIRCCMLTENLFEIGMGTLLLARGSVTGPVTVAAFLLDTFCLGVKDVIVHTAAAEQLGSYVNRLSAASPLEPVDPAFARKLLHDLTRWSSSLGFQPSRDYAAVERLFGSIDPRNCDTEFKFGMGGKPLYMSGPTESPSTARERVEQLSEQLGPDGFDDMVAI